VHTEKTVATELALPAWLPHASYLWRVAAVDDGVQGAWSRNGTFTRGWRSRPELLSPAVGAAVAGRPTFSWTPVPGASAYQLQVSTSSTFAGGSPLEATGPATRRRRCGHLLHDPHRVTPFTGRARPGQAGPCVFSCWHRQPVYWRSCALDRYVDKAWRSRPPGSSAGISYLPPTWSRAVSTAPEPRPRRRHGQPARAQRQREPRPVPAPASAPRPAPPRRR
jgi:hypothetical protein